MILPFVREFFADVEKVPAFARAVTQVKGGAGRIRVSGLTPTGKALFYALLHRAISRPLVIIVSDNRAVDELLPLVRSLADLTGAVSPDAVIVPARLRRAALRESLSAPRNPGGARHRVVEDRNRIRGNRHHSSGGDGHAPARGRLLRRPGQSRPPRRDDRS